MLRLHVVPAQGEPFDHVFEGGSLVIGRSSGSDLVIADRFLSRHHARLFVEDDDGKVLVEDLGSRNGTLLNNDLVQKPTPVSPGDVIKISGSVISVHSLSETGTPSATPFPGGEQTLFRRASDMLETQSSSDTARLKGEEALRRFADRVRVLNDVHHALGRSISLEELLELILDRVFDHLRPEQAAIFLKRPDAELYRAAARSVHGSADQVIYSRSLAREVTEKGLAALVLDAQTDERFAGAQSILSSGIRSILAAPLLSPEGTVGMIALNSRATVRQFSEGDMELLVSLASVAAMRIRNVALAEEAAQRRLLEEELALARRIQVALLPSRMPELSGYELHGANLPSRHVSGDYYEVLERNAGEECVLMIADVSGKGIGASLLTAALESLAAVPIEDGLPPDEICSKVSRLLYRRTPHEKYATAFLAVLEPATGKIRYTNAGHNPALIVRASGEAEELEPTGLPVGLMPEGDYQVAEATLEKGDLLVLYTDGITEAANPEEEEYGVARLVELCRKERKKGLGELADALQADLSSFTKGVPFADDRTFVLARRNGGD